MVASIISFLAGAYTASAVLIFILGAGDPDGRFKLRYALFWPFFLPKLFGGFDD